MFILVGLTQQPELQLPLFLLLMGIYEVMVMGNLGMILPTAVRPLLHTPVYYFFSSLSFIDLCYSPVITPKMLVNYLGKKNVMLYSECMSQLFVFVVFVDGGGLPTDYDGIRSYAAICNPLLYNVVMPSQVCPLLVLTAFILGFLSVCSIQVP